MEKNNLNNFFWTNSYKNEFVELVYPFLGNLKDDFLSCSALYHGILSNVCDSGKYYIRVKYEGVTGWDCKKYLRMNYKNFIKMSEEEEEIIKEPMCEIDITKWYKRIPLKDKCFKK